MCLEKPLGLNLNRIEQWGLAGFQSWHLVVLTVDITDMKNEFQSSNRSATKTDDGPHLCGKHFCRPTLSPTLELWISWTSHGVPAMAIPCFGINQSRTARFGIPRYQNFNQIPNLVICRMYKISMYIYIHHMNHICIYSYIDSTEFDYPRCWCWNGSVPLAGGISSRGDLSIDAKILFRLVACWVVCG